MPKIFWRHKRTAAQSILDELAADENPHRWIFGPIPELQFRALAAWIDQPWPSGHRIRWEEVRAAVNHCIETKRHRLEDVESALERFWAGRPLNNRSPQYPVRVILPLYIVPDESWALPIEVQAAGVAFQLIRFATWEQCLQRRFETGAPLTEEVAGHVFNLRLYQEPPPALLEILIQASSAAGAVNTALHAAALWRASVNFSAATTSFGVQLVAGARSAVPEPDWIATIEPDNDNRLCTARLFTQADTPPQGNTLHRYPIELAANLLSELPTDEAPGSTARHAVDGIKLYTQALDQPRWHLTFLMLWQLAEHLTLQRGQRGKHEEMCRRLAYLTKPGLRDAEPLVASALQHIKDLRHDLVHGGVLGAINDSDVAFLDRSCKDALWWLVRNHKALSTLDDLWLFLEHTHTTEPAIAQLRRVLDHVEALHRNPQGEPSSSQPAR